eukprot:366536-Chlamydomonas_euryale.AAC.9
MLAPASLSIPVRTPPTCRLRTLGGATAARAAARADARNGRRHSLGWLCALHIAAALTGGVRASGGERAASLTRPPSLHETVACHPRVPDGASAIPQKRRGCAKAAP